MTILHLEADEYPAEAMAALNNAHEVEPFACTSQTELLGKLKSRSYDVIFTRLGLMLDDEVFCLQPELKYVVTSTTGLNHIDTHAAALRKITVVSLKGEKEFLSNIKSTAEHTWGLLLALIRHIPEALTSVAAGGWDRIPFMGDELDGKKIGIIGYGRLGKILAQYAKAFGMDVLVHDHTPENYLNHPDVKPVSVEDLLMNADYVVLLISWSEANTHYMNEAKFRLMKEGAYFINTARGELIDEKSLVAALVSGKVKGAAVDVLNNDSAWASHSDKENLLLRYARDNKNLLITPHIGGYGKESIARTRNFVTSKFLSLVS